MDTICSKMVGNITELLVGVLNCEMPGVKGEENFLDQTFEYKHL